MNESPDHQQLDECGGNKRMMLFFQATDVQLSRGQEEKKDMFVLMSLVLDIGH